MLEILILILKFVFFEWPADDNIFDQHVHPQVNTI